MLQLKLGLKRSIFLLDEKTGAKIRVRLLNILPENMIEIGFDAPKDIRILRDALYYRNIKETNAQNEGVPQTNSGEDIACNNSN